MGLPKVRGYIDTELIKKVQEKFPQTKLLKSTSDIIQWVFLKVLEDPEPEDQG